jgi:drug/metabolite transporter (DMT)-like permease
MDPARRATFWLLSMCAIWGSSFFSMKLGEAGVASQVGPGAGPTTFLFLRFALAAALFPMVYPRVVFQVTPRLVAWGMVLSVPFYSGFLLQVSGLQRTTPTVSAFLTNLTVALTPVLGRMFFKESLRWNVGAGAAVALGGVTILTNPVGGGLGPGEILTATSALAWAVQIQLTNVITRRYSPEGITWVMFLSAALYSALSLPLLGVGPGALGPVVRAPHVAWSVLYNATACSVLAITIMNRFQRDISPTRASVIYTLEPVFAAAFAALFVGEPMTPRKLAGGALIVAGNLLCELLRPGEKREDPGARSPEAGEPPAPRGGGAPGDAPGRSGK